MFVSDFIDEAKVALNRCSDAEAYARITDAVSLIANQSLADVNMAQMDLCVCNGCVTLPYDVDTILSVNVGGQPTLIRDQLYQYHINGSGSQDCTPCRYTDELGQFCTHKDPSEPVYLVAELDSSKDNNTELRVYGWDADGKRIYTEGANGQLEDGFLVPTVFGFSQRNPYAPAIARFDRIKKGVTTGFVKLLAVNTTDLSSHTLIGYYQPRETVPTYRRIRVPDHSWVRLKYKRKNLSVTSEKDWINIENREALFLAIRAVQSRRDRKYDEALISEREAIRIINKEVESKMPPSSIGPQIKFNDWPMECGNTGLFY
jgi:hypothetical protein